MPNTAPVVLGGDERYTYHHCEDAGVGGQKEFERDVRTEMKPSRVCALHVKDAARANRKVEKLTVNLHYPKKNQLNGSLDMTKLPLGMIELCLSNNCFSGTVDLSTLSSGITLLSVSDNQLYGEVFLQDRLFYTVFVEGTKLVKHVFE